MLTANSNYRTAYTEQAEASLDDIEFNEIGQSEPEYPVFDTKNYKAPCPPPIAANQSVGIKSEAKLNTNPIYYQPDVQPAAPNVQPVQYLQSNQSVQNIQYAQPIRQANVNPTLVYNIPPQQNYPAAADSAAQNNKLWNWAVQASGSVLAGADYAGSKLASFFGMTTPKYDYYLYYAEKEKEIAGLLRKRRLDDENARFINLESQPPVAPNNGRK